MEIDAAADFSAFVNAIQDGFVRTIGLRFVRVTADEVVAELEVAAQLLQGLGIVHGGVHAGIIESVCSVGAAVTAMPRGQTVVGLENHTSFVRAVREGRLVAAARPVTRGRRSQLWEATIRDDAGRVVATGRVRLLCLDEGTEVAGKGIGLEGA